MLPNPIFRDAVPRGPSRPSEETEHYYAAGWKPNQPPANLEVEESQEPMHVKITQYKVTANTATAYAFSIYTRVTAKDLTKDAWTASPADVECRYEGNYLVLRKQGEDFGAVMKLPRKADPGATPSWEVPDDAAYGAGVLLVIIPKLP